MKDFYLLVFCFSLCSCSEGLSKERAGELVRLTYKQQSNTTGEGKWSLNEIVIDSIIRKKNDTPTYWVFAHTQGLYKLPVLENAPSNYIEKFYDTLQFTARKINEVWMADDWIILGARHE